jgi:hypothetical protein
MAHSPARHAAVFVDAKQERQRMLPLSVQPLLGRLPCNIADGANATVTPSEHVRRVAKCPKRLRDNLKSLCPSAPWLGSASLAGAAALLPAVTYGLRVSGALP